MDFHKKGRAVEKKKGKKIVDRVFFRAKNGGQTPLKKKTFAPHHSPPRMGGLEGIFFRRG